MLLTFISWLLLAAFSSQDVKAEPVAPVESKADFISNAKKIKSFSERTQISIGIFHKRDQQNAGKVWSIHFMSRLPLNTFTHSIARSFSDQPLLYRLMLFPRHYFW